MTLGSCSLMSANILQCFLVDSTKMRVLSIVFFRVAFQLLSFCEFSSSTTCTVLPLLALTCCFLLFFCRQTKLKGSFCCSSSMTSRCIFSASSAFFASLAGNSRVGRDGELVALCGSHGGSKSAGTYIVFISTEISCYSFIAGNVGVSQYCRDFRVFAYRFCQR